MEYITTTEIDDYLFEGLTKAGYAPQQEELYVITDIVFDYLIHKGIITEDAK